MNKFYRTLKFAFYLPIIPCNFKLLVRALRFVTWLPQKQKLPTDVRRILIAQPHNSLGDLVLSFPFIEEVHRLWPEAEIDLVVGNAMVMLFQSIPFVRQVIGYTPSSSGPPLRRYLNSYRILDLCHRKIADTYDLAFDPRWDSDIHAFLARALAFTSGAPIRVGYSGRVDGVDPSLDAFLNHSPMGGRNEHESIRKLRLLQRAGLSTRFVEKSESSLINATLIAAGEQGKQTLYPLLERAGLQAGERYAILSPSASTPERIWPIEYLSELTRALHKKHRLRFIVVGAFKDIELCTSITNTCPGIAISIAGKTNVLELLALIIGASLFIGNDSGPAHLSGMSGRPTVVVSPARTPSDALDNINAPKRFRPCGPNVRLVQPAQPPANQDAVSATKEVYGLAQVSVRSVLVACEDLLSTL